MRKINADVRSTVSSFRPACSRIIFLLIPFAVALLAGCGGGGGGTSTPPVTPPVQPPPPSTTKTVTLAARQLAYDTVRQKVYASVDKDDKAHPNTVAVIDVATGTLEKTITVRNAPNKLAISKDAKYLYVGEDEGGTVARIDLASQTVGLRWSLGTDPTFGMYMAGDLAVMPGHAETVAVVLRTVWSAPWGVGVFDNDVRRPTTAGTDRGLVTQIAFSESGDKLFGYDDSVSSFNFVTMKVDASGVMVQDIASQLLGWGYGGKMAYDNGRAYSTLGFAADITTRTVLGRFWFSNNYPNSVVAESGTAYFLVSPFGSGSKIWAFDANTLLETGSIQVPVGPAVGLVKCGTQGFAFISGLTSESRSVVITTESLKPVSSEVPPLDKLIANRVVYSPLTRKVYASVPARAGVKGNSVAVIDPATKNIETFIPVGSDPNAMALSEDGNLLYVSLGSAGSVARVNLSTQKVDLRFSLGSDKYYGPRYAYDMAVMPGRPGTVAVAMHSIATYSPNLAGVAVYDDGVQRPKMITSWVGDKITFSGSPSLIYVYNGQVGGELNRLNVDETGVTQSGSPIPGVIRSNKSSLRFADGLLYTSQGAIIDPEAPAMKGLFAIGTARGFALDTAGGHAYFLADGAGKAVIYEFDRVRKNFTGYEMLSLVSGDGHDLAQCGGSCFAVAGTNGIAIANGSMTPAPDIGSDARNLPVYHMVYDAGRGRIYASVPGAVGPKGNTIAVIDPVTATITSVFYVGSEPSPLALSKDGNYLYVGLDGSGTVAKVDVAAQSTAYDFGLGMAWGYGPLFSYFMSVSPDDSDVVAVSCRRPWGWSPLSHQLAIFDHGAQLSNKVADFQVVNSIAFGDSGADLFGYNAETTGWEFYRFRVDGSGVALVSSHPQVISGFYRTITYDSGLIYATDGSAVTPEGTLAGRYPGISYASSLAAEPGSPQLFFLTQDWTKTPPTNIFRYDKANFTYLGMEPIAGVNGDVRDLVRYGDGGIAFATEDGHIVFTRVSTAIPVPGGLDKLAANHLLYDKVRQRLYATVPGSVPGIGNRVAVIDPATSTIEASIPVGSEPDVMAMSDDAHYLYVGLTGEAAVRRIDLTTRTADTKFALGADSFTGPFYAESIAVMPGDPRTVAVSRMNRGYAPRHEGVGIYTAGVQLPATTPDHSGSNTIAFAGSASTLYGYNNESTSYGFFTMQVDSNGVSVLNETSGLLSGRAILVPNGAQLYTTTGAVIDPVTKTVVGTFAGVGTADAVVPDTDANRVYFLTYDNATKKVSILGYDKKTFQSTGRLDVTEATSRGLDLAKVPGAFAVATAERTIIVKGSL